MEGSHQEEAGGATVQIDDDAIAHRAYEISLRADGGSPEENWTRARQELQDELRQ
jgi:hypothetical protein